MIRFNLQQNIVKIVMILAIPIFGVIGLTAVGVEAFGDYQDMKEKDNELSKYNEILVSRIAEAEKSIMELKNNDVRTVSEVAGYWSPKVANILCGWNYSDGSLKTAASGSGFLTRYSDGSLAVMTNKHVIIDEDKYTPELCSIEFPDGEKYILSWDDGGFRYSESYDIASISTENLTDTTKRLVGGNESHYCSHKASIGDQIVAIGYPTIGSKNGVTVTDGIISGYDGDYYITSAKIEHGDSGGIAVSIKDNCIVGMLTLSVSGKLESLGRILSSEKILE